MTVRGFKEVVCGKRGSHVVPGAMAAPVTVDSISPAHLFTFTLGTGLGELALPL